MRGVYTKRRPLAFVKLRVAEEPTRITVRMSASCGLKCARSVIATRSPAPPISRASTTGVCGARCRRRIARSFIELRLPLRGDRVIQREGEIGAGRRFKPLRDDAPRFEPVGERDDAEIMPQRRAHCEQPRPASPKCREEYEYPNRATRVRRAQALPLPPSPSRKCRDRRKKPRMRAAPLARAVARDARVRSPRDCRSRVVLASACGGTRSR